MAEVLLEHISKIYPRGAKKEAPSKAIEDISFTVHDKEFMVIVGPSGCGKSTLLRMIAGLEEISEGTLSIDGKRINDLDPRDRDIAMVFQNYALYPHMTVYDNMAFGLRLKHFSKTEIKQRVTQTAQLLEMEEVLNRKPTTLSGGQRQRVAIGRAIIRRPKVFLFDEPLSNLDAKLRSQMRIELQKLHRDINATMIYVTHDQTEAMTLGNRIAVLNKGKLMQLDTPLHLYNNPANKFVAGFIGSPTMNFMEGSIVRQNRYSFIPETKSCQISLGTSIPASLESYVGKAILIGIRPEHILICEEGEANPGDCTLKVLAYENMGNEQLVYFSMSNQTLIVRTPPREIIDVGNEKEIKFLIEKIIYMDAVSGAVINKNLL
ncbi:MAG: sn-glycerol-3-phosphate ABC transporter ATP-binding protein UgpC [Chitinophagales bacterium]|nr:sn-glycerol-3-phosphate ABC transporter ATP-binding protein UgpC [Chitinophagales bacterium]